MKVEYVDHMGDDLRVANAARVSFDKHKEGFDDGDRKLLGYLGAHDHWTPFAHCVVTVRETIPIFVARQRIRHTVGFAYNEVSRRYINSDPEYHSPEWRWKAENKKQGSAGIIDDEGVRVRADQAYYHALALCDEAYHYLLELGVCPEQARSVLPLASYTSWYVTGSLAAWARAYNLRIDPHAQKEIQDLAKMWDEVISPLFPVAWEVLTNGKEAKLP